MGFISYLFKFLGTAVSIYSFICIIRIFLTWIPGADNSSFGLFIKNLCDPWLNIFRRFNIAQGSGIDFSPIIGIGVLYILSTVFQQIAITQSISVGIILAIIIKMAWSIISSLLTLLIIIVLLRLLSQIFNWTNPFWYNLDRAVSPVSTWIRVHFLGNKFMKPSKLNGITALIALVIQLVGAFIINILVNILSQLPF